LNDTTCTRQVGVFHNYFFWVGQRCIHREGLSQAFHDHGFSYSLLLRYYVLSLHDGGEEIPISGRISILFILTFDLHFAISGSFVYLTVYSREAALQMVPSLGDVNGEEGVEVRGEMLSLLPQIRL
jgi:hypothetical protein